MLLKMKFAKVAALCCQHNKLKATDDMMIHAKCDRRKERLWFVRSVINRLKIVWKSTTQNCGLKATRGIMEPGMHQMVAYYWMMAFRWQRTIGHM